MFMFSVNTLQKVKNIKNIFTKKRLKRKNNIKNKNQKIVVNICYVIYIYIYIYIYVN